MSVTELDFGDWLVTTYEAPVAGASRSFDTSIAMETEDGVTLAVADAAINVVNPQSQQLAERALTIVSDEVAENGIARGIEHTARLIHDPSKKIRGRNANLTFAGVQIGNDDTIEAFRCGDSEVWARYDGQWFEVMPGDMLTEQGRAAYAAIPNPTDREAFWLAQEVVLNDPGCWVSPAIGFDSRANARRRFISGADEIVVSTDGAKLNEARLDDLAAWMLDGVHVVPENHPWLSPHGDLTVIHAVRLPQ